MSLRQWLQRLALLRRMNWIMTAAVLALLVVGVLFVYSACFISQDQPVRDLYKRQIFWALTGLGVYAVFAMLDYRSLRRLAWWGYGVTLLLLVLVLVVGTTIYGARRWLMVLGFGIQPSELAKLALVFLLARRLSRPGENFGGLRELSGVLLIALAPFLLIMKEPDLGTAMVILPVTFIMMFAAGVPYRTLVTLLCVGLVGIGLVLSLLFLPRVLGVGDAGQVRIMRLAGLSPYHRDRLSVFFDADSDPLGAGWNKRQSEIAVGSGGLNGKGYLQGTQNILGFLPRSVAPTDFIFSVIAEETGFVGSTGVVLLYALVLVCGVRIALGAPDKLGRLVSIGVVTLVFCHVFINIAMTVGLMPITGLPLPLLSYGGSFMVVVMASLGLLQSIHIRSQRAGLVFEQGLLWQTV